MMALKKGGLCLCIIFLGILMLTIRFTERDHTNYRLTQANGVVRNKASNSLWKDIPSFEMNIRMSNEPPRLFDNYQRWFLKSYRLFWPLELNNLTIVLNNEVAKDHEMGKEISSLWPYPRVAYLDRPAEEVIGNTEQAERFRMYYDGFYPEKYTQAEYIGFADTDTMFTTIVTPESLFEDGKPVVIGYIGKSDLCYSEGTEFLLKQKSVMNMAYFPVIMKVSHLIEMRKYIEKIHSESFAIPFYKTIFWKGGSSCSCQFCVMINYMWYFHRDEYSFHFQMYPDKDWNGSIRDGQQPLSYFHDIEDKYKVPKPRISIHARYINEKGVVHSRIDTMTETYGTWLDRRVKEGMCYSVGFDLCPNLCLQFSRKEVQASLFSFEAFVWLWDKRCFVEQEKHYRHVKRYLTSYIYTEKKVFGYFDDLREVCTLL